MRVAVYCQWCKTAFPFEVDRAKKGVMLRLFDKHIFNCDHYLAKVGPLPRHGDDGEEEMFADLIGCGESK